MDDIEAIRKAYSLDNSSNGKIHLVGHSWGGVLARHYAQTNPEHVASLLLLSPTTVHQASDWSTMELAVLKCNLHKGGWIKFSLMGLWSLLMYLPSIPFLQMYATKAMFTKVIKNYYFDPVTAPNPTSSFLDGVSANATIASKTAFLKDVQSPLSLPRNAKFSSLVIFGQEDIYGKDLVQSFCNLIQAQGGESTILPLASHISWVDQPIALVRRLKLFYS
jgi:pimeloyl-ACP methyl ester carboxylesterase